MTQAIALMTENIASTYSRIIVGSGVTGLSCARYLHQQGLSFSVVDTRENAPNLEILAHEFPASRVYAGQIPQDLLNSANELIVSPGISLQHPAIKQAVELGVKIVSDIDLFIAAAKAPVVGITGSNAKSTVTTLLGEMAAAASIKAGVGGNLGTPALDLLAEDVELYVIELSSFQLERCGLLKLKVATVLNVTEDHLDRHQSMQQYHAHKHHIYKGCSSAVYNAKDPLTQPLVPESTNSLQWRLGEPMLNSFGLMTVDGEEFICYGFEPFIAVNDLALKGRHNVGNVMAAIAIAWALKIPETAIIQACKVFAGLPHRCQLVATLNGVSFINDSKATNPASAKAALEGLGSANNVFLIAGGQGKGADFASLQSAVAKHCKQALLIGEDAEKIQTAWAGSTDVLRVNSLQEAVELAAHQAKVGDIVLLSPACASLDMFKDYKDRGEQFEQAVQALAEAVQ